MTAEEWRPIAGFPDYFVSSLGEVRSDRLYRGHPGPRLLAGSVTPGGYRQVLLYRPGQRHGRYVHDLVTEAFIGPKPEGQCVRHLNGDPAVNTVENLAYGTYRDNMLDSIRHGTCYWAARTHCSKGHEFTPENTRRKDRGGRVCITCRREWDRNYKAEYRRAQRAAQVRAA